MGKYINDYSQFVQNKLMENIEEDEYKIFRDEPVTRIERIPLDNLNDYIKSQLTNKKGVLYCDDDNDELVPIKFGFESDDILIYPDGKYKLLPNVPPYAGCLIFDLRYPNEICKIGQNPSPVLFGYRQWLTNNRGDRWVDGNDCFIVVEKIA